MACSLSTRDEAFFLNMLTTMVGIQPLGSCAVARRRPSEHLQAEAALARSLMYVRRTTWSTLTMATLRVPAMGVSKLPERTTPRCSGTPMRSVSAMTSVVMAASRPARTYDVSLRERLRLVVDRRHGHKVSAVVELLVGTKLHELAARN